MTAESPSSTSTQPNPSTPLAPGPSDNTDFLIRTTDLAPSAWAHVVHPFAPTSQWYRSKLGDGTGFTKTGVHLYRLPAGTQCSPLHWHENEDEWMYILDAGEGAAVLVWEPSPDKGKEGILREVGVKNGDFLGFRKGVERAHTLKAGTTEMKYLVGGSRSEHDVCHYPMEGKKLVVDWPRGQTANWVLEDEGSETPRE